MPSHGLYILLIKKNANVQPTFTPVLNNFGFSQLSTTKDLGVVIRNDICWYTHISEMLEKTNRIFQIVKNMSLN